MKTKAMIKMGKAETIAIMIVIADALGLIAAPDSWLSMFEALAVIILVAALVFGVMVIVGLNIDDEDDEFENWR